MVIRDIYYVCMVHPCVRLRITLTAQQTAHFMWAGVLLTNAAMVVLHTRKGNKLKGRQEWEREARQNE